MKPPPKAEVDLEAVVAKYRPVVGFKIRRAVGWDNPDWEDLTNEVLTQTIAAVRAGEFRGDSQIGTFIYTIACRRIVDHIREIEIARRFPVENDPAFPGPVEEYERIRGLAAAVSALPPKYREVLDLYYYRASSAEETALRLGLVPAWVSERVHERPQAPSEPDARAAKSFFPSPD